MTYRKIRSDSKVYYYLCWIVDMDGTDVTVMFSLLNEQNATAQTIVCAMYINSISHRIELHITLTISGRV